MASGGSVKSGSAFEKMYEAHEDELLDASHEEFQYVPNSWPLFAQMLTQATVSMGIN
jgi:hypothetical protein